MSGFIQCLVGPSLVLYLINDILLYPDNIESVNEGWADAMARILFKNLPEGKVLSSDCQVFITSDKRKELNAE